MMTNFQKAFGNLQPRKPEVCNQQISRCYTEKNQWTDNYGLFLKWMSYFKNPGIVE